MEIRQIVQQYKDLYRTHGPVLEMPHLPGLPHFCGMCHNSNMTLNIVNLASDSVGYSHLSMLLFWVNDLENAAQENNIGDPMNLWMGLCTDEVHGRDFLPN